MPSSNFLLLVSGLLSLLNVCNGFPTGPNTNNTLVRRQCLWNAEKNDWVCTRYLPTLGNLIHRMRNPDWLFSASDVNVPVFYSNLIDLDEMQNDAARRAEALGWVTHWLLNVGKLPYYNHLLVFNREDKDWFARNLAYIAEAQILPSSNGLAIQQKHSKVSLLVSIKHLLYLHSTTQHISSPGSTKSHGQIQHGKLQNFLHSPEMEGQSSR